MSSAPSAAVDAIAAGRALSGVGVLGGDHDRERNVIFSRQGKRVIPVIIVGRIPLTVGVLRVCNGVADRLTLADPVPEGPTVGVVTQERDRLGIAVNDLDALLTQRPEEAVSGHAQTRADPDHVVRRILHHVVGNHLTVDTVAADTVVGVKIEAAVIGAAAGIDRLTIGLGDAVGVRQRDIGIVRTGDTVGNIIIRIIQIGYSLCSSHSPSGRACRSGRPRRIRCIGLPYPP